MKVSRIFGLLGVFLLLGLTAFGSEEEKYIDQFRRENLSWSGAACYLKPEKIRSSSPYLIWLCPRTTQDLENQDYELGMIKCFDGQDVHRYDDSLSKFKMIEITEYTLQKGDSLIWGKFLCCICKDLYEPSGEIKKSKFEIPEYLMNILIERFPDIEKKKETIFGKERCQEIENKKKALKDEETSSTTIGLGFKSTMGGAAVGGILAGVGFDWVAGSWIQKTVNNWVGKKPLKEEDWTDPDFFEEGEQVQSQSPLGRLARGVADVMVGTTTFAGLFWILKRI